MGKVDKPWAESAGKTEHRQPYSCLVIESRGIKRPWPMDWARKLSSSLAFYKARCWFLCSCPATKVVKCLERKMEKERWGLRDTIKHFVSSVLLCLSRYSTCGHIVDIDEVDNWPMLMWCLLATWITLLAFLHKPWMMPLLEFFSQYVTWFYWVCMDTLKAILYMTIYNLGLRLDHWCQLHVAYWCTTWWSWWALLDSETDRSF